MAKIILHNVNHPDANTRFIKKKIFNSIILGLKISIIINILTIGTIICLLLK